MICLKGFATFTALCLVQSAKAEPKYIPKEIPRCTILEIEPGITRCTYSLEQVRSLYRADSELSKLKEETGLKNQKIILQEDIIEWQQGQLSLSAKNNVLFHERMNTLTALYIKTDKRLQQELARPRWGSYVAWGVAAAAITLFTGYVVADQISK